MKKQVPDAPFRDRNGEPRTWLELRTHIRRLLLKRFSRVDREIVEDALSDAYVDLIEKWQDYTSSRPDGEHLSFGYGLLRGTHVAADAVREAVALRVLETPYAFGNGLEEDDAEAAVHFANEFADTSPGPEELVEEADEHERARRLLADLPQDELEDVFDHLLTDESQRDLAQRLGLSQSAVRDRIEVRRRRVRDAARKYGLSPLS